MTDTTITINGKHYNVIVYRCAEHGGYRAEAAHQGRVVEVVDVPGEREAWIGIRQALAKRTRCHPSR